LNTPRSRKDASPAANAPEPAPEGRGDAAHREAPGRRAPLVLGVLLFLLVAGIFLPAVADDFITYDDPVYVTDNAHVKAGLTSASVRWAFQSTEASNWHPLTWLSHMADIELFGLQPWGHHLTSLLLHALNAVLLFAALRRMTGALWRSLFVAALFGLHPLHVESVAWVSERKDVLSTTFWMLALWAYALRAEAARSRGPGGPAFYGLALLFFALGLMCKPMLVTLPCVLLLLDYWPLKRWGGSLGEARRLLVEKLPFFALSAAACAVTLYAQGRGEAVASTEDFPLGVRLANALIAYCRYLGKCFVPAKLAVFYPDLGGQPPVLSTVLAVLLLASITAAALVRRRPYLLIGWLWFLGTLVPVIGLVQVGGQSMADRYSYVPLVGIFVMAAWAAEDLTSTWAHRRGALGLAAGAVLAGLAALTSLQLNYWRNGTRLFRHAVAVTPNNWVAHANLFATLSRSSESEATAEFRETVRILTAVAETHDQKGIELERTPGHTQEAVKEFRAAARIMPDLAEPHYNLGTALVRMPGHMPEAIEEFRAAVRLRPDFADAHFNLGTALASSPGDRDEAIAEYEAAVRLRPDNYAAHFGLAYLLSAIPGRASESIAEYQAALRLRPGSFEAHFNLGIVLSGIPGRTVEAIGQFEAALAAKPDLERAREMIARLRAVQ
jgi:tetratricopeptide (TPR) repeat protein